MLRSTMTPTPEQRSPLISAKKILINAIQILNDEFNLTSPEFQPFLVGSSLNLLNQCLVKAKMALTSSYQEVLTYLADLLVHHNELKKYLNEIHSSSVNLIISNEFDLLDSIMSKMQDVSVPCESARDDAKTINLILIQLINHAPNHIEISKIQKKYLELEAQLNKRAIQNQVELALKPFKALDLNSIEGLLDLRVKTDSIEQGLKTLRLEALKENMSEVIETIDKSLEQIESVEIKLLNKQVSEQLEKIQQNAWVDVQTKKTLYYEMILPMGEFLKKYDKLKINETQQELYISTMRAGFELSRSKEFLGVLKQCSLLFYQSNPTKMLLVNQYIEQSYASLTQPKSVLKRVRFEELMEKEDIQDIEPHNKKQSMILNGNDSEVMQRFVNILAPVTQPEMTLSRRFVSELLGALSLNIWQINGLKNSHKLTISYDLLVQATAICPNDDSSLLSTLQKRLDEMTQNNSRAIRDYKHFSSSTTNKSINHNFTVEMFKGNLAQLVDELSTHFRGDEIDKTIETLVENWLSTLEKDGRIGIEHLTKMKQAFIEKEKDNSQLLTIQSEKPVEQRYASLKDAIVEASPEDFITYLKELSKKSNSKEYLNLLIQKNNFGYTVMHTIMYQDIHSKSSIDNIKKYFSEVESLSDTNDFKNFLIFKSNAGYTFLHQATNSGNLELVKYFCNLLKEKLGEQLYAKALRIENDRGYAPHCKMSIEGSKAVNKFIDEEKNKYPRSLYSKKRGTFFDNHDKRHQSDDEKPYHQKKYK